MGGTVARTSTENWVALIVAAVALIPAAILGLFAYMSATATPLHPEPQRAPSVMHASPSQEWASAAERGRHLVRAALTAQNLPGLSVAVGLDGDIVWVEGFGWADLERRVPVAPGTRFRIGTASKALTSAAVGLLLEDGRLKLDDDIRTYVPEFPEKQWPLTLRQLMGHVAGVRNDGGETGYGLGWDLETVMLAGEQTQTVGHDGATLGGPVASLITLRDRGIVVAVTSNISYADTAGLALQIADAFLAAKMGSGRT
jgi:CubicO group peptidase (beta-lactamase class C family)